MEDGYRRAVSLLPEKPRQAADRLPAALRRSAEDFRLRTGFPATVLAGGREYPLDCPPLEERQLREVIDRATDYSYHAAAEELRRGYLSAGCGVRVGVCGGATVEGGALRFQSFSSVSIRIPRQIPMEGEAYAFLDRLSGASVLVTAPPGAGKTTLLRELIRRESERGSRVSVADERGELAAVWKGRPQFSLGPHTDVLSGAGKAEAAMLLLRAMNPQVLAMDEISAEEDARALLQIAGCGVRILATVHGTSPASLQRRPALRLLLEAGIFQRAVVISRCPGREYRVEQL